MNFCKKFRHAFTIIEMAIALSIVLVLIAILIPVISNATKKANIKSVVGECARLYNEYKENCEKEQISAQEGLIFVNDDYQYVIFDNELKQVNFLGTLKIKDIDGEEWFLENVFHIVLLGENKCLDGDFFECLYLIDFGREAYDIYSLDIEDGRYIFLINDLYKLTSSTDNVSLYNCPFAFYENTQLNVLDFNEFLSEKCLDVRADEAYLRNAGILGYEKYSVSISNDGKCLDIVMDSLYTEEFSSYEFKNKNKETINEFVVSDVKKINIGIESIKSVLNEEGKVTLYIK